MLLKRGATTTTAWRGLATTPRQHSIRRRHVATTAGAGTSSSTSPQQTQQEHSDRQQQLQQQWFADSRVYYSNYPLNRAQEQRRDEAQLTAWFNAPNARVTPVMGSKVLLFDNTANANTNTTNTTNTNNRYTPVWLSPAAELGAAISQEQSTVVPPLFLGLDPSSGAPHFAVQVTHEACKQLASAHPGSAWLAARSAGPDMSRQDAALMAVASGLAQWNLDAQYHGASGEKTLPRDGGFSRRCSSSGRSVYPRIDPAIITLVTCGDWCLLGRKAEWPPGRYSTLAGFLELGESLEQALCREVLEESAVEVDLHSVRYVASQPWPFPRSLMVGFYAHAAPAGAGVAAGSSSSSSTTTAAAAAASGNGGGGGGAAEQLSPQSAVEWLSHQGRMAMMDTGLRPAQVADAVQGLRLQQPKPQEDEMEDVRWFHRDWLHQAIQQGSAAGGGAPHGFFIPGEYSLAYKLITEWLAVGGNNTTTNNTSCSTNGGTSSSSSINSGTSSSSPSSSSSDSSSGWIGDAVPDVDIDPSGVFKYVLLRLTDGRDNNSSASSSTTQQKRSKLLVRGAAAAAYHNHILQAAKAQVQRVGGPEGRYLDVQVLGGGRIEHYPEQQVVSVYGYSAAFGPAVHEVAAGLIQKAYPFYNGITWSYEGY